MFYCHVSDKSGLSSYPLKGSDFHSALVYKLSIFSRQAKALHILVDAVS